MLYLLAVNMATFADGRGRVRRRGARRQLPLGAAHDDAAPGAARRDGGVAGAP